MRTQGNIMTPTEYEQAELERMIKNIQLLEQQISDMNTGDSRTSKSNQQNNPTVVNMHGSNDSSTQGGLKAAAHSFMGKMSTPPKNGTEDTNSYANPKNKQGSFPNPFGVQDSKSSNKQQPALSGFA